MMIKRSFSLFLILISYFLNMTCIFACEPCNSCRTFVINIPENVIPGQNVVIIDSGSSSSGAAVAISLGAGIGAVALGAGGFFFGPKIAASFNNATAPVEKVSELNLRTGVNLAQVNNTNISANTLHLYALKLPETKDMVVKVSFKSPTLKDNDLEFSLLDNYSLLSKVKQPDLNKFIIKPIYSVYNKKSGIVEREFKIKNLKDNYILAVVNKNNKVPMLNYNISVKIKD